MKWINFIFITVVWATNPSTTVFSAGNPWTIGPFPSSIFYTNSTCNNNVLYIKNRRRSIYSCITLILKIESHYWEKMRWKSLASLSKVRENKILASFVLNLHLFIFFSCLYTFESGKDVPHAAIFWKCTPRQLYHNRHHPPHTHTHRDTHKHRHACKLLISFWPKVRKRI